MQSGREINSIDVESKNRVCLIGTDVVDELFPAENPVDKTITVNGISYTVIGTLQFSGKFAASSNNNSVIIPYTTAMSLLGKGYISSVDMYIQDENLSDDTTSDIEAVLNSAFNYNEDGYIVTNMHRITSYNVCYTKLLRLSGNFLNRAKTESEIAKKYPKALNTTGLILVGLAILGGYIVTAFGEIWPAVIALTLASLDLALCAYFFRKSRYTFISAGFFIIPFTLAFAHWFSERDVTQSIGWMTVAWGGLASAYIGISYNFV